MSCYGPITRVFLSVEIPFEIDQVDVVYRDCWIAFLSVTYVCFIDEGVKVAEVGGSQVPFRCPFDAMGQSLLSLLGICIGQSSFLGLWHGVVAVMRPRWWSSLVMGLRLEQPFGSGMLVSMLLSRGS